jgi:hypothetical protein
MATPALSQPQAFNAEGKPIAPADYAKAAAAGELHFEKGARVFVRNSSGQLGSVPAEEAGTEGLQILSPDQVEAINQHRLYGHGFGNMAQAAAEGVARPLGGDAALTFFGADPKALKGRKEENPVAATGGEVAGMLAPMLIPGGGPVGAFGRLAEGGAEALGAEGAGMLATGARMAARGAAESALYGAGSAASQAAIDDTPLTAERLLAGAWDGAKVGGAFGGAAGFLGAGVGKVGRKLLGKITEGLPAETTEGVAATPAAERPVPVEASPPEPIAEPPVEPPAAPSAEAQPAGPTSEGPGWTSQTSPNDFHYGGPETFEPAATAEPPPLAADGQPFYGPPPEPPPPAPAPSPPVTPTQTAAAAFKTRIADYLSDAGPNMLMGILTGHPLGAVVGGAGIKFAKQLIMERGADVMATLADRLSTVSGRIDLAAKVAALAEKPKALIAPTAVNVPKMFEHYSGLVSEAQNEPLKFAQRIGNSTADIADRIPDVAAKMQQTILADMAYLNSIHPAPPSRSGVTLTPLAAQEPVYSFNQKQAFTEAAMALDNPLGVFNMIARGDLPLDGINAIKVRRPGLFQEMREGVMKHTMTRKEELPFKRRMLLGVAFDYPADWSMLNVASIQTSLASVSKSPNNPHGAPTKVNDQPGEQIAPGAF